MDARSARIPVLIVASDPISEAGVRAALRVRPELTLVSDAGSDPDTVILVIADSVGQVAGELRGRLARGQHRLVLITAELPHQDLLTAVELGVRAAERRSAASADTLVRLIRTTVDGAAALPEDVLGDLLTRVARLQRQAPAPSGVSLAGLTDREVQVLRLVAEGRDTAEIARSLCYSPRTVKAVLHNVVNRFQLRNRTHAVAYALREGLL